MQEKQTKFQVNLNTTDKANAPIKNTPVKIAEYFRTCKAAFQKRYDSYTKERTKLENQLNELYEDVKSNIDYYVTNYNINFNNYKEFVTNSYIDGTFYKVAKRLFINKKEDHTMIMELYDIFSLAKLQRAINELDKQIHLSERVLSLSYNSYMGIVKQFYQAVHKHLILEGEAYHLGSRLGYLCINRCKSHYRYKRLDYNATNKRKAELIADGKRLWNKDEAEYCKLIGKEYDGVDYRVYKNDEYYYEFALLYSNCKNGYKLEFECTDYRASNLRGTTYDDLIKMCGGDKDKICELNVDIKTKLALCNKVDKYLYSKFIRNENQNKYNYSKVNRKD